MSRQINVYWASIRGLLSVQVTIRSSYCLRVSVHRDTACRECVVGEVSIGLLSRSGYSPDTNLVGNFTHPVRFPLNKFIFANKKIKELRDHSNVT